MIKYLIISEGLSYPPMDGGGQAMFNAVDLLQYQMELHVIVVGNCNELALDRLRTASPSAEISRYNIRNKDKYEKVNAIIEKLRIIIIRIFKLTHEERYRKKLDDVNLSRNWRFYSYLNSYIQKNNIDIVQFEFYRPLTWAKGITNSVKKVFVQHEIQYIVKKQRLLQQKNISKNDELLYEIEKNMEIHNMNYYDAIITLSENDTQQLIRDGVNKPIFSSFANVILRKKSFRNNAKTVVEKLTFIGPEVHMPNKNGLLWFLKEVWPKVLKSKPLLRLNVIGSWTKETKKKFCKEFKNIQFEGFVDNLEDAITGSVLIVPIFQASGIRMKILEAVNLGVPFVSTPEGAVGLGFTSGLNCFLSNDAADFANNILILIDEPGIAEKISIYALRHVREKFSDSAFIESRMKCIRFLSSENNKSDCGIKFHI